MGSIFPTIATSTLKGFCAFAAWFVTSFGYASAALAVDVPNQTVCQVQEDTLGRIVLAPCGGWTSQGGCGNGWVEWYERESQGGGKGMHAMALIALMTGKTVMLRIDTTQCSGQWDHLTAIRLEQ